MYDSETVHLKPIFGNESNHFLTNHETPKTLNLLIRENELFYPKKCYRIFIGTYILLQNWIKIKFSRKCDLLRLNDSNAFEQAMPSFVDFANKY